MIRNGLRVRAKTDSTELAAGASDPTTGVDADLIRELAQLVSESDLAEIEVEKGDLRIRVTRHHPVQAYSTAPAQAYGASVAPAPAQLAVQTAPAPTPSLDPDHVGLLKSPMVGTVYRRQNPESKPFVEIGSTVKAGERVLLVEAMKTFNDIVAHKAGIVTAIYVEDSQPVEFGEPLILIVPADGDDRNGCGDRFSCSIRS